MRSPVPPAGERPPDRSAPTPVQIPLDGGATVSGLLTAPADPVACYVMAHGAGADMHHDFLASVAEGLAERGMATLRYQFPFTEAGRRRPDRPSLAHATVRAAMAVANDLMPGLPLVAGGKSFGARMTSQAQAEIPLSGVRGLVFFGFPLHPAGRPSLDRASHLVQIGIPMLFIQGTRDTLADLTLLGQAITPLGGLATLERIDGADHGFHVTRRSGRTDAQALSATLDVLRTWLDLLVRSSAHRR